jgi:hypothetical protein
MVGIVYPAEWNALRELHARGLRTTEMASELGLTRFTVYTRLYKMGLGAPPRPSLWDEAKDAELMRLYPANVPLREIETIVGIGRNAIKHRAETLGLLRPGRKAPMPRALKPSPWNPDMDAALRDHLSTGKSFREIADLMGLSRNAAIGRAGRIGLKSMPTPEQQLARREAKRLRAEARKASRQATRYDVASRSFKIAPLPFKPRAAAVEPSLDLGWRDRSLHLHCNWITNDDMSAPIFCGHALGKDIGGKRSSFCQGHHNLCYQPTQRQREAA